MLRAMSEINPYAPPTTDVFGEAAGCRRPSSG
jgi:hypothetical protein